MSLEDELNQTKNVIIIGSGPAGHTAAIYAARARLNPIMFEGEYASGVAAGGQLTTTTDVENFPGFPKGIMGPELMFSMREQSINCGTTIYTKTIDSVDFSQRPFKVSGGFGDVYAHVVIIATGATAKRLHIYVRATEAPYRQNVTKSLGFSAKSIGFGPNYVHPAGFLLHF